MPIKDYSTTAGSNTSVAGINIAEGCPAANVNNGMRAMMADTRSFYENASWTDLGHTPTRTGATTFTVVGDYTAYYVAGRRIRCTDSTTLYGTIASSSYSAPNTTVTVTLDSGSLSASLTAVAVSIIDPTGDPIGSGSIAGGLPTVFADNEFRVQDNGDATKQLAFEVSGVITGTTATMSFTNNSMTIPATGSDASKLVLQEHLSAGGNTATIVAPATMAANRTYTLPDEDGTVVTTARVASDTVAGITELATVAETQTGSDATRAVTPASLKGAVGFSSVFESAEQALQSSLNYSASHGLGQTPRFMQIILRCKTAEQNYSVNDEAMVGYAGTAGNNTIHVWANSTSVGLITGTNFLPTFALNNKTTSAAFLPTPANWRLVVRVWA
jgi:hypothetical protein